MKSTMAVIMCDGGYSGIISKAGRKADDVANALTNGLPIRRVEI